MLTNSERHIFSEERALQQKVNFVKKIRNELSTATENRKHTGSSNKLSY